MGHAPPVASSLELGGDRPCETATVVSGLGIAFIKEHFGWGVALGSIALFALVGMSLFMFPWNAPLTGMQEDKLV